MSKELVELAPGYAFSQGKYYAVQEEKPQSLTNGVKFDKEKPRYDLLPPEALDALVQLYTYGATKYEARNWEKGMSWGRVFSALMRHAWAWWRGESKDAEGFHHMTAVAWGAFTLYCYETRNVGQDDRVKTTL